MDNTDETGKKIDKNVLDLLWKLTNSSTNSRIDAAADIFNILLKKQSEAHDNEAITELSYIVKRLVKGLASSRGAARLGFSLLLTKILKQIDVVDIENILELVKKCILNNNNHETKDIVFAELFAYSALIRCGKLPDHSHLSFVVIELHDLWVGKDYISNACYELLFNLFSQLTQQKFQQAVWPHLLLKLSTGFQTCSANNLWPLMLCMRMFPEVITKSYLREHWKTEDLFSDENFEIIKKIIRQTTSCLPMLHPFCLELVFLLQNRKHIKDMWNVLIDENLFEADYAERTYVGFEMIKKILEGSAKKKLIKIVLSLKFRAIFLNCLLHKKHPLYPAAVTLADFFSDFIKQSNDSEAQIIILKVFLQMPGTALSTEALKIKQVSNIIQNLLPDAVNSYCEFLKSIALNTVAKNEDHGEPVKNHICIQAVVQIGSLACHSAMNSDIEWKLSILKFLFLHAFFKVENPIDILHCEETSNEHPAVLKDSFSDMFFKTVASLHHSGAEHTAPQDKVLQYLTFLMGYVDQILDADECITPNFSLDKLQASWQQMKSIVHKLSKQRKKDGKTDESQAFQVLFLELGFHLFQDPEHIPGVLEELHICCKKALKFRKSGGEHSSDESEPAWISVVVDILLSLLSRDSHHLRVITNAVFPMFCSFIDENALHQILDVINPEKAEEDAMLVDESDEESDADFVSGSSNDESDSNEQDNSVVDEAFRKKVKEALGAAAEVSDAESVVLSDSEMFKLDDTLAEAFRSRVQPGHTQLNDKDKAMLNFRVRCLDLVADYLKSEPPMYLVIQCIPPVLAAYEYAHKGRHQEHLLHKVLTTLKFIMRIKKFQHLDKVDKSQLINLLKSLISKCHKEKQVSDAQRLYGVCVFIVLCIRKLKATKSAHKESKKPSFLKVYLEALKEFVNSSISHAFPQLFTSLMEACPDLAWHFIQPCQEYAFGDVRMYRKTQCFGLISEALKYSKAQSAIASEVWLQLGNNFMDKAIKILQDMSSIKPTFLTELLNAIHSFYYCVKENTGESLLEDKKNLLELLINMNLLKVPKNVNGIRRKLVMALGGKISDISKKKINKLSDLTSPSVPYAEETNHTNNSLLVSNDEQEDTKSKTEKRKSKNKQSPNKKMKFNCNGTDAVSFDHVTKMMEDSATNIDEHALGENSSVKSYPKKKSKSKKQKENDIKDV